MSAAEDVPHAEVIDLPYGLHALVYTRPPPVTPCLWCDHRRKSLGPSALCDGHATKPAA